MQESQQSRSLMGHPMMPPRMVTDGAGHAYAHKERSGGSSGLMFRRCAASGHTIPGLSERTTRAY